jgi:molybdopterin-guanine dinucleotide biosynthesis protein A
MIEPLKVGGIVLCGGRSSRMGQSKALLPFGSETMLSRVVRIVSEAVSSVVVVAAQGQTLPELPPEVVVVHDEQEALGPLAGLAVGLAALSGKVEAAYLSSCDVPLLKVEFVRRMIGMLGDCNLAIPREGKLYHPLSAVYRTSVEPIARDLVAEGRLRPFFLLERLQAREVDLSELREIDPDLASLRNVNCPEDYAAALRDAGLSQLQI